MKRLLTLLGLTILCSPALAKDSDAQRQLVDRVAIEEVMQKYVWSVDALDADGKPIGNLYHVISNERIAFVSPSEAIYQSYWQTMRKGTDNRYLAGGFGRSEDRLVKRNGQWLIKSRKLVVFTD